MTEKPKRRVGSMKAVYKELATPKLKKELEQLYIKQGLSIRAIAERLGWSKDRVFRILLQVFSTPQAVRFANN